MQFVARTIIHASPERVFAFHELPDAHRRLTPPWSGSRVIVPAPSLEVGARAIVDIRVAPLLWIRTELVHIVYEPPARFVDEQVRGPFKSWRHTHLMTRVGDGTELADVIDLETPFGALAPILIIPRLRKLFAYRHRVTREWCERSPLPAARGEG